MQIGENSLKQIVSRPAAEETGYLGRCQANLCFHFAGSGENLPDITKSRDASLDNDLLALSSRS